MQDFVTGISFLCHLIGRRLAHAHAVSLAGPLKKE